MRTSLESKGSCPKGTAKRLSMQMWLRYDEPSLKESGNNALFQKEIAIYPEDKLWDVLKVNTVFRRTVGAVKLVFLSDLSKQEVLDRIVN